MAHVCVGYLLWCDSSISHVWGTYSGGAPRWAVCGVLTLVGLLDEPCAGYLLWWGSSVGRVWGTYSGGAPRWPVFVWGTYSGGTPRWPVLVPSSRDCRSRLGCSTAYTRTARTACRSSAASLQGDGCTAEHWSRPPIHSH